jgi:hypothetical protein
LWGKSRLKSWAFAIFEKQPKVNNRSFGENSPNRVTLAGRVLQNVAKYRNKEAMDQGCQMVCFQTKNPNLGKF